MKRRRSGRKGLSQADRAAQMTWESHGTAMMAAFGMMSSKSSSRFAITTFANHVITRGGSFDHLVGERKQLIRHRHAKRFGGPQVEHKLHLYSLLDR
jgi:hypothetical protein